MGLSQSQVLVILTSKNKISRIQIETERAHPINLTLNYVNTNKVGLDLSGVEQNVFRKVTYTWSNQNSQVFLKIGIRWNVRL